MLQNNFPFTVTNLRGIGSNNIQKNICIPPQKWYSDYSSDICRTIKSSLDFLLRHFAASPFPRRISTKTTQGRQIIVYNKKEALARFKQANYLDCRINAYNGADIKGEPNFLFLDIDTTDHKIIKRILNGRFKVVGAHPTVLFTGSGFHIYQPISSGICLDEIEDFSSYHESSTKFLRFAEKYLSNGKCDPNHNPSFKSCMVRIPGSINSKNGEPVRIIQEWDGQRPNIALLLGSFLLWLSTKQRKEQVTKCTHRSTFIEQKGSIIWIEQLLKIPLEDYRKTITNLVLAPYLMNIRKLQYDEAFVIIQNWLNSCAALRKLDFNASYLINLAFVNTQKNRYKPMGFNTLKERNPVICRKLKLN